MGWETESEFGAYTGDCAWAAVHMAAGHLAPLRWPLPDYPTLNRLTAEAIAAGIGVGPEGQATPEQIAHMLGEWGVRYGIPPYSVPIANTLGRALARGKPVILCLSNGQALPGDEAGLHGHALTVLHAAGVAGYGCGDGDNPVCRAGQLAYYSLAQLEAAQPFAALVIEEVPGQVLQVSETNGQYVQRAGFPPDTVWNCTVPGHQYDVQHAELDYFRLIAPVAGVALPLEALRALDPNTYEARFDLYTIRVSQANGVWSGRLVPQAPAAPVPCHLRVTSATLADDGNALHVSIPYSLSGGAA